MKIKRIILPTIIIVIGIIAAVASCLLKSVVTGPTVTEHDFNYSVTYKLNGEIKTVDGVYRCEYKGISQGVDYLERIYNGHYFAECAKENSYRHTIAKKGELELYLIVKFSGSYFMADPQIEYFEGYPEEPYFLVFDSEGVEYDDEETLEQFNVELVSWEYPEPIENTFVFIGFRDISADAMMAMLGVAILTVIACAVFVKKDKNVVYGSFDQVSAITNFAVGFIAIPITVILAWISSAFATGPYIIYQLCLCIPALIAFTVAASISLRRKGFARVGFFIQFAGVSLFSLLAIAESLPNYF